MSEQIKIDAEPRCLQVISEPYVIYTRRGYQPALDVYERKTRKQYVLYIAARSLTEKLEILRRENAGRFNGLEFWIRKESYEKTSPYIVEEI